MLPWAGDAGCLSDHEEQDTGNEEVNRLPHYLDPALHGGLGILRRLPRAACSTTSFTYRPLSPTRTPTQGLHVPTRRSVVLPLSTRAVQKATAFLDLELHVDGGPTARCTPPSLPLPVW